MNNQKSMCYYPRDLFYTPVDEAYSKQPTGFGLEDWPEFLCGQMQAQPQAHTFTPAPAHTHAQFDTVPSLSSSYSTLQSDGELMYPFEVSTGDCRQQYWFDLPQDISTTGALHPHQHHVPPVYTPESLMSSPVDTGDHSLQCRWYQCTFRTAMLDQLIAHIREIHVGSGKPAYLCLWEGCPRIKKPFTKRHKMHNHMRTHTGERPFACTVQGCSKRFSRPDSLSTHIKTHSSVRPYPCRVPGCGKAYFHSRSLRKHTKSHEQEAQRSMLGSRAIDIPQPNTARPNISQTMLLSSYGSAAWPQI